MEHKYKLKNIITLIVTLAMTTTRQCALVSHQQFLNAIIYAKSIRAIASERTSCAVLNLLICRDVYRTNNERLFFPGIQNVKTSFPTLGTNEYRSRLGGECRIDSECPATCHCERTTVDCSGRNLKEIPRDIPLYTTELYVSNIQIEINNEINYEIMLDLFPINIKLFFLIHSQIAQRQ